MNALPTSEPFVLLDDARRHDAAPTRLYRGFIGATEVAGGSDAAAAQAGLEALTRVAGAGVSQAGFLGYELGALLEPRLQGLRSGSEADAPLLWMGQFAQCDEIDPAAIVELLPDPQGAWIGRLQPRINRARYDEAFARVQAYIAAGDIYQANLTFQCDLPVIGHPLALYAALRERAGAGYGGVVWTGRHWILSLSPELFFTLHDGRLTARPMKGTALRFADPAQDTAAREELVADPKQRAENLMIVDLLRNDLARVAVAGSVAVPDLFRVESYPTVHQMTSTVTARLQPGLDVAAVLRAIFPCGSITGAPKLRAMEIVDEIESDPRGIYTGAIGRIDPLPDGGLDAAFNVAIRTLYLPDGAGHASLGLGSGIVADSVAGDEWRECLAKGRFVTGAMQQPFDLVETMRFSPDGGLHLLDRHIARMRKSARAFGWHFDRHKARNDLQAATFRLNDPARVRLLLSPTGRMSVEVGALPSAWDGPVKIAVAPLPVAHADFRLVHKTTDRGFYDQARLACGAGEVIFIDPQGFVTEGSFTNVFVERDGVLLTPPLNRGLLPGVLRAELLATGKAVEADLRAEDLAQGLLIGNALRGLHAGVIIGGRVPLPSSHTHSSC